MPLQLFEEAHRVASSAQSVASSAQSASELKEPQMARRPGRAGFLRDRSPPAGSRKSEVLSRDTQAPADSDQVSNIPACVTTWNRPAEPRAI